MYGILVFLRPTELMYGILVFWGQQGYVWNFGLSEGNDDNVFWGQ